MINPSTTRSIAKRSSLQRSALRASIALLCMAALGGCSTVKGWMHNDKKDDGKPSEPMALSKFDPSLTVNQLWSADVGKGEGRLGARQGPVVADGRVYAAAVEGGVRALDLQTGKPVWHYESKLDLTGGPGVGEGVVVIAGLNGEVIALDAANGTEKWHAKVNSEVVAAPAIGMGMAFVHGVDGRVTAFDVTSGERRWFWTHDVPLLSLRGNDAPSLGPGYLFVGNDDGTVSALSAKDGSPTWSQPVSQADGRTELDRMADVDGSPALEGTTLYASSFKRQTVAIDAPSGRPMWVSNHGGAGRIGVGASALVVSDANGSVFGLDKNSGAALWQQPGLARRNLTAPVVQGDYAVVGDYDGYVHWLKLDTGAFAARTRVGRDALRAAPIVADGVLLVQNVDGKLSAFRLGQ